MEGDYQKAEIKEKLKILIDQSKNVHEYYMSICENLTNFEKFFNFSRQKYEVRISKSLVLN